jgi:L-threonylcarbamoyladenylate synthase
VTAPIARWRFGEPLEPLRERLRRGGVLAIPTESSYGLAVDPRNPAGVEAVYRIKSREAGKPLLVVVADLGQLAALGIDPGLPILERLAACWPGPLTAVLPSTDPPVASAGGRNVAVRIPDEPRLRELLRALGHGLTATSANRSGGEPILDPEEAAELLAGEDALVVDGGRLPGGPPSTLVAIEEAGPVVLRTGRFPIERLQALLGLPVREAPYGSRGSREVEAP